jgi:ABC-2 type transport system ATP-binding protein
MSAAPLAAGSASSAAVEVEGVAKKFAATVALDDVSFTVNRAELFGFIGPDGAGKTTLFRILTTLLTPDKGHARVLGHDVVRDLWTLRARVGYMPGRFSLYPDLSVDENLRFFASVFGTTVEREYQQIAPIYSQLEPFRDRRAAALSGGMKQKLALACTLVHEPELIVLDEPTTGVDPISRREFWKLLSEFLARGLTILMSTPYLDEAERCTRVALLHEGRVLANDEPARLRDLISDPMVEVVTGPVSGVVELVAGLPGVVSAQRFGERLHVTLERRDAAVERFTQALRATSLAGAPVRQVPPSLEDVFIAMLGNERAHA